jgi:hypothetical protein
MDFPFGRHYHLATAVGGRVALVVERRFRPPPTHPPFAGIDRNCCGEDGGEMAHRNLTARAWRRLGLAVFVMVLVAATAPIAGAADRMVLGEYFTNQA